MQREHSGSFGGSWMRDTSELAPLIESVATNLRRMRELGKGKVLAPGPDEAWECMTKVADVLKRTPALREIMSVDEIVYA